MSQVNKSVQEMIAHAHNFTLHKQKLKEDLVWSCFTVDGEVIEAAKCANYFGIYATADGRVFKDLSTNPRQKQYKKQQYRELMPSNNGYGYVQVKPADRLVYVHAIVADAFLVKPESNKPIEINHIDMNRQNNHLSNLEYCTRSENRRHAILVGKGAAA